MNRRFFLIAAACATPDLALAQSPRQANPTATEGARQSTTLFQPIVPQTDLERTFLAAFSDEEMRTAFRRQFLESQVVLALASNAPDAGPREGPRLPNNSRPTFVFTTSTRMDSVLGPASPRRAMTGRAALERLRGRYLFINYGLEPMLTLEPDDVARFLALPRVSTQSAGPAQ